MDEATLIERPGVVQRFWANVDTSGGPLACWPWTGSANQRHGYGRLSVGGRFYQAHRLALAIAGRAISPGLEPDHTCRVRLCVNPAHLDEVTHAENVRRGLPFRQSGARAPRTLKRRCIHGHDYTPANTRVLASGFRACRMCIRATKRRARVA